MGEEVATASSVVSVDISLLTILPPDVLKTLVAAYASIAPAAIKAVTNISVISILPIFLTVSIVLD